MRSVARIALLLLSLSLGLGTAPAAAQLDQLPAIAPSSCSLADSVLGKPVNEELGALAGLYDSHRDSTYLFVSRKSRSIRSFVPYTGLSFAGSGPFEPIGLPLGLTVIDDASELARTTDSLPVTLVLDDFTIMHPGNLTIGRLSEAPNGAPMVQVGVRLSRAALLVLLHSKSALLKWGHWHVDLERSDIGALRAFQRTLLCAPASIPHYYIRGDLPGGQVLARPNDHAEDSITVIKPRTVSRMALVSERISCARADSLFGPRRDEEAGALRGYSGPEMTVVALALRKAGLAFDYDYDLYESHAGPGPFDPGPLTMGLTIVTNPKSMKRWADTMPVNMVLDDSLTRQLGVLKLNPAKGRCCSAPLPVSVVLNRTDLLSLLAARRARFSWADVFFSVGPADIGMIRAFERTMMCAPESLDSKNLTN